MFFLSDFSFKCRLVNESLTFYKIKWDDQNIDIFSLLIIFDIEVISIFPSSGFIPHNIFYFTRHISTQKAHHRDFRMDPIEVDEDQTDPFVSVSTRDNLHIIHRGRPSSNHSPLANVQFRPNWPENLWTTGQLVYSIKHPEKDLPPPENNDDDILRFDSRFESGNLSRAYKIGNHSYHLILEYDHSSNAACTWFYFMISNMRADIKYQFYISGFYKETSLFCSGEKIFFYSEKRAREKDISWTHEGSKYAFAVTTRTKTKLKRSTLQFRFKFPYDNDKCFFCYAIPYTYSELLRNIENWKKIAKPGVVSSKIICQTLCGRDVPFLQITSPNSSIPLAGKSCIFLTCRIHPGESSGSFVLHGLIDFLLSDDPCAKFILDHCLVRIVPMLNVDGVVEGSYRISLMGQDLNRMWDNPNPVMQPVIYATKKLIAETATERPLVVYIDFHGHSNQHGTFAFGCPNPTDLGLKDAEKTLPRLCAFLSDEFSWENCVFSFPKERKNAGRIVIRKEMGVVQSFTIEASFGAVKAGKYAGLLYDETLWKKVGADCGLAIYHYLIPTASPLVSYVNKELAFFAPKITKDEIKQSDQDNISKPSDRLPCVVCKKVTKDNFYEKMSYRLNHEHSFFDESQHKILREKQPQTFLSFDPDQISDKPPPIITSNWKQMEFVELTT